VVVIIFTIVDYHKHYRNHFHYHDQITCFIRYIVCQTLGDSIAIMCVFKKGLIQKKISLVTFQCLNKVGITQTRESYWLIMDDIGGDLKKTIANQMSPGQQLRICFDNMDFRILVNITLKSHQNSDKHWIAHYLTFDRVPCRGLDEREPRLSDSNAFDNINYLLSKDELETVRQHFIVLVTRVLLEFFEFMKPLESAVPVHITLQ